MANKFNKPSWGHKSYNSAINGVAKYFQAQKPDFFGKVDGNQFFSKLNQLMIKFLKEHNFDHRNSKKHSAHDYNANVIQSNWVAWKAYVENVLGDKWEELFQ